VNLVPVSAGIRFLLIKKNRFDFYGKLGPNVTFIRTKQEHPHVFPKHSSKFCFGGVVGTGVFIKIKERFVIDPFFDYIFNINKFIDKNSNSEVTLRCGGIVVGAGLGFRF